MGFFYTNIILYKVEQQPVADFLKNQGRPAYISPDKNDFIVVYDKATEDQNTRVLMGLTENLTKYFKCTALASLIHDSDIYMYWLYDKGQLLDTYNSLPGYFDPQGENILPTGGDVQLLCSAFQKQSALPKVQTIFAQVTRSIQSEDWAGDFLQGEEIHLALIKALDMPSFGAYIGYKTLENEDFDVEELDLEKFLKIEPVESKLPLIKRLLNHFLRNAR